MNKQRVIWFSPFKKCRQQSIHEKTGKKSCFPLYNPRSCLVKIKIRLAKQAVYDFNRSPNKLLLFKNR